jgi:hypothetical protein
MGVDRPLHIFLAEQKFEVTIFFCKKQAELIFNPALNGKAQEWQLNGGQFDKPPFWVHFYALRSLLSL